MPSLFAFVSIHFLLVVVGSFSLNSRLSSQKFPNIILSLSKEGNDSPAQETMDTLAKRLDSMLQLQMNQDLLNTRLRDLDINRTIVGPSTVPNAGNGLYAACDCPKGTILTCYPGDALVIFSESGDNDQISWGKHVKQSKQLSVDSQYMLQAVSDDWGIAALPGNAKDTTYLGHYANDGAKYPTCEADLSRYVLESDSRANAMHQPIKDCHMVTIATKDIEKGQEIFVTYGPEYWMEQPMFGTATSRVIDSRATDKGFG